jgi:hypothetical protein
MQVSVNVDASDLIDGVEDLTGAIKLANTAAVARIQSGLRGIVREVLETAFAESGLHEIYQEHLRSGFRTIRPVVYATADGLVAEYFDPEGLGDYGDLEEGFHYRALLAISNNKEFSVSNPQVVYLPYRGEELYNDFDKRYDFWQAVVNGEDYEISLGKGKSSHSKIISTAGMYERTLRARVSWWGDRYPEWLLLEYGQDYEPYTPPTHFKDLMEQRIQEFMEEEYEEILNSVVEVWNKQTTAANVAGRLYEKSTGRFAKYLPDD